MVVSKEENIPIIHLVVEVVNITSFAHEETRARSKTRRRFLSVLQRLSAWRSWWHLPYRQVPTTGTCFYQRHTMDTQRIGICQWTTDLCGLVCFTYACIVHPQPTNRTSQPAYPQRLHRAYSSLFIVVFPNKTPGLDVIPPPMSMSSVSKVDIIMWLSSSLVY